MTPGLTSPLLFVALGAVFLVLAAWRRVRGGSRGHPQAKAWTIVGVAFVLVAWWLSRHAGA